MDNKALEKEYITFNDTQGISSLSNTKGRSSFYDTNRIMHFEATLNQMKLQLQNIDNEEKKIIDDDSAMLIQQETT